LDRTAGKPCKATAQALGVFAYYAIFARRFQEALGASRRGRSLDDDEVWIDSNRAHALMYLGREKEALHLYLAHRNKRMASGLLWQDDIEDDFVRLTDAGIGHAAMPRMMQALGIKQVRGAFERATVRTEMLRLDRAENYVEALKRAQTHEALLRDRYGDAHIRYAEAVAFVGRCLHLARHRDDLSEYRRALAIAERVFGRNHVGIVPYLNDVIEIYQPTAAELSERAFAIVEKTYGPESPELVPSLMQLGRTTQEYDKRPQIFERALALARKYWPEDYDTLAPVMRELSRAYTLIRPQDAVTLHEQLVAIADRAKGVDSQEFSYAFYDLADVYTILDDNQNGDLRQHHFTLTFFHCRQTSSPRCPAERFRQEFEKHLDLRGSLPARRQQGPQWITVLHLQVLKQRNEGSVDQRLGEGEFA
jgi:tetratricopeptide (TPR) repeat protein